MSDFNDNATDEGETPSDPSGDKAQAQEGASSEASLQAKIVTEAVRLFATRGYHGTSIRELSEACGCTKPSVYYYFRSKAQLYRDVIRMKLDEVEALMRRILEAEGPIRERAYRAVEMLFESPDWDHTMRLLHRLEMRVDLGAPEFDLAGHRKFHHNLTVELVRQGMASGELANDVDPDDCALALAGQISYLLQLKTCGDDHSLEQIGRVLDIVFYGMAQHAPSHEGKSS